jgi:alanine dehydrogenase
MIVGIPREIKNNESRVAIIPSGVKALTEKGHNVIIEHDAGIGIGITDDDYVKAGAEVTSSIAKVYDNAEMILKVKEPLAVEYNLLREGQILFTFLHLAANKELTKVLLDKKVTAIAYETIQTPDGAFPILSPMSMIAGRLASQIGANYLQINNGGKGILLGGILDAEPAKIVILGGGVVGLNAAEVAVSLGGKVTVLEINPKRIEFFQRYFNNKVTVLPSNSSNTSKALIDADLLIGAVMIPGALAPKLVSRDMIRNMSTGGVIVDVAIDQGGLLETSKPTTHQHPTYVVDGIIHYAVPNMPGIVPHTSTYALTKNTIKYIEKIASQGWVKAVSEDSACGKGLNIAGGEIKYAPLHESFKNNLL